MGLYILGLVSVGVVLGFFPNWVSKLLLLGWLLGLVFTVFSDPTGTSTTLLGVVGLLILVPARVVLFARRRGAAA